MLRYTRRQRIDFSDFGRVQLEYGVRPRDVYSAIDALYAYLHAINKSAVKLNYGRLEESMLPAAFSGFISEMIVQSFANAFRSRRPELTINRYPNGHPDLVPRAKYVDDSVLSGRHGLEIKTTRSSSIQSHNQRAGAIIIVDILCDTLGTVHERLPTTVLRVRYGVLTKNDWKFYDRKPGSRRTITAAMLPSGKDKLVDVYANSQRGALRAYMREKRRLQTSQ
jgi:hypothetical protein